MPIRENYFWLLSKACSGSARLRAWCGSGISSNFWREGSREVLVSVGTLPAQWGGAGVEVGGWFLGEDGLGVPCPCRRKLGAGLPVPVW